MENYTFELEGGIKGYFQRNEEECFLYIDTGFMSRVNHYQWSHWIRGATNYSEVYPETIGKEEIARAIGYFAWNEVFDRCPYHPIVTNLSHKTDAGLYYPRTNRGEPKLYHQQCGPQKILDEIRAFNNICNSLTDLFNYIDPDTNNLNCHGNKIRELLIISCTEVEYLLLNFLTDNNYSSTRFSTKDYVKALPLLKLDKFTVHLSFFPSLQNWSPFKEWSSETPTASLTWYDAYNSVKHDRGTNKHKASLSAVINSVAAIHILLEAQYGKEIFNNPLQSTFKSIFETTQHPEYSAEELCCPKIVDERIIWDGEKNLF